MAARLSDLERTERTVTERDFQRQVTELAERLGWSWCHWRPLQNRRGFWQTPVEGPLGAGWPDLTLLRARDRRLVFAELKRELEQPTPDQRAVLVGLSSLYVSPQLLRYDEPRVEVYVWRPSDLRDPIEDSAIGKVLR